MLVIYTRNGLGFILDIVETQPSSTPLSPPSKIAIIIGIIAKLAIIAFILTSIVIIAIAIVVPHLLSTA